jgi:hypothetical protein
MAKERHVMAKERHVMAKERHVMAKERHAMAKERHAMAKERHATAALPATTSYRLFRQDSVATGGNSSQSRSRKHFISIV